MCSSPARTPKHQVAAEQPLTGGYWSPPKKISRIQRQRRSCSETVGGYNHNKIKSHTHWMGDPQTEEQ